MIARRRNAHSPLHEDRRVLDGLRIVLQPRVMPVIIGLRRHFAARFLHHLAHHNQAIRFSKVERLEQNAIHHAEH